MGRDILDVVHVCTPNTTKFILYTWTDLTPYAVLTKTCIRVLPMKDYLETINYFSYDRSTYSGI